MNALSLGAVLVAGLLLCSCATPESMALHRERSIVPPPLLGAGDLGDDRYVDAEPQFAGVDVAPVIPQPPSRQPSGLWPTTEPDPMARQGRDINCRLIGDMVIQMSRIGQEKDGSAAITTILDTRLIEEWWDSAPSPKAGEKVPVVKCWARVRWSANVDSDVSIWLLIDSDDNMRVRWDEIANVASQAPSQPSQR